MLDQLPFDISYQILLLVDPFDLVRWSRVSKSWRKLLSHPLILDGHHIHEVMITRNFPAAVQKILVRHRLDQDFPKPRPLTALTAGRHHGTSTTNEEEEEEEDPINKSPFDRPTLRKLMRVRAYALKGKLTNRVDLELPSRAFNDLGVKVKYEAGFCIVWSEGNRQLLCYDLPYAGGDDMYAYTIEPPRKEKILTATIGGGKLVTATLDKTEEWLNLSMIDIADLRTGKVRRSAPLPVRKLRLPLGGLGSSTFEDKELLPEGCVPLVFGSTPLVATNGKVVAFSDSYVSKITTWVFPDDDDGKPVPALGTFDTTRDWRSRFDTIAHEIDVVLHLPLNCGLQFMPGTDDIIASIFMHHHKYFAVMPMTFDGRHIGGITPSHETAQKYLLDMEWISLGLFESCREMFVRFRDGQNGGPLLKLIRKRLPPASSSSSNSDTATTINYTYDFTRVHEHFLSAEVPSENKLPRTLSATADLYMDRSSTDHFVWFPSYPSHSSPDISAGSGVLYQWEYLPLTQQSILRAVSVAPDHPDEVELNVRTRVQFDPWGQHVVTAQGDEMGMVLALESFRSDKVVLHLLEYADSWYKLSERSLKKFSVELSTTGFKEMTEEKAEENEEDGPPPAIFPEINQWALNIPLD